MPKSSKKRKSKRSSSSSSSSSSSKKSSSSSDYEKNPKVKAMMSKIKPKLNLLNLNAIKAVQKPPMPKKQQTTKVTVDKIKAGLDVTPTKKKASPTYVVTDHLEAASQDIMVYDTNISAIDLGRDLGSNFYRSTVPSNKASAEALNYTPIVERVRRDPSDSTIHQMRRDLSGDIQERCITAAEKNKSMKMPPNMRVLTAKSPKQNQETSQFSFTQKQNDKSQPYEYTNIGLDQIANAGTGLPERRLQSSSGIRSRTLTGVDSQIKRKKANLIAKRTDNEFYSSLQTAASQQKTAIDDDRDSKYRLEIETTNQLNETKDRRLLRGKQTELGMQNHKEHVTYTGFLTEHKDIFRPQSAAFRPPIVRRQVVGKLKSYIRREQGLPSSSEDVSQLKSDIASQVNIAKHVRGGCSSIITAVSRQRAMIEKGQTQIRPYVEDMNSVQVEGLVKSVNARLQMNKTGAAFINKLKQIDEADLQEYYDNNRQQRNFKLYKTYAKEWQNAEVDAVEKLSSGKGRVGTRKVMEKRISVMNHDKKVRAKLELQQVNEILKAPERPATANSNARMAKTVLDEKDEVTIFTMPPKDSHVRIGTGARQLYSTDVDVRPQSVAFIRSASIEPTFNWRKSSVGGTQNATPNRKLSVQENHPSNKKFDQFRSAMNAEIQTRSYTQIGQLFNEKIAQSDSYAGLSVVGKSKFKLEKRYCTRYTDTKKGRNSGKTGSMMQYFHGYFQNGEEIEAVKDIEGAYQTVNSVYQTGPR